MQLKDFASESEQLNDEKRPPSGSAAEIKYEAYKSLDEDGKQFIDQLAYEISVIFYETGIDKAKEYMQESMQNSEHEWTLALWWKLGSKIRTAFKK